MNLETIIAREALAASPNTRVGALVKRCRKQAIVDDLQIGIMADALLIEQMVLELEHIVETECRQERRAA